MAAEVAMQAWLLGAPPVLALSLLAAERWRPARALPAVRGWHARAIALNLAIAPLMVLAGATWEPWLQRVALLDARTLPAPLAGLLGFLAFQFLMYGWHRAKHRNDGLWRWLHQIHHSPRRIEVLTAHYAHPLEFAIGLLLAGTLLYGGLGLSAEAFAWFALLETGNDLLQHANLRTPRWLGYVLQRPEMHRLHHERGVHAGNYGLPLWDALFGTWRNPRAGEVECGFDDARETRLGAMLAGIDVHAPPRRRCCLTFS
jgi:sterol desaturase/sphingolipid hydroxylase (fatty acid hydroxylase superfamily)